MDKPYDQKNSTTKKITGKKRKREESISSSSPTKSPTNTDNDEKPKKKRKENKKDKGFIYNFSQKSLILPSENPPENLQKNLNTRTKKNLYILNFKSTNPSTFKQIQSFVSFNF